MLFWRQTAREGVGTRETEPGAQLSTGSVRFDAAGAGARSCVGPASAGRWRDGTMASYLYNSLKRIVVGEEDDDPSCLKDPVTMSLYEDPLKGLGLKQTAMPWDMRDALRTNCLSLCGNQPVRRVHPTILH